VSDTPTPAGAAVAGKANARRAPRLPLEFAVLVRYQDANGEMIRSYCKTVSVSVDGALLALDGTLHVGQSLQLTNVKTSNEVQCTVRSVGEKDRANHIGIEFGIRSPEFWEISFPRQEGDPPAPEVRPKARAVRATPTPASGKNKTTPGTTADGSGQLPAADQPVAGTWRHKKALIALAALLALAGVWMLLQSLLK